MDNQKAIEILEEVAEFDDSMYAYNPAYNEALQLAIAALEKQEAIKSCTPPSDDWEHYADRLHDIAYKYGYEEGKRNAGRWTPVSENLPEDGKDVLCIAKSKFGGFYCVASHGKMYPGSNEVGWITSDYARLDESVILAWMLLPELYQEDDA